MNEERVIDHWQNPIGKRLLAAPTYYGAALNPGCGDTLRLDFRAASGIIEEVGFDGKGCVMSLAGGSLLVEWMMEHKFSEAELLAVKDWPHEKILDLTKLLYGSLPIAVRMGCVLLPIRAMQNLVRL